MTVGEVRVEVKGAAHRDHTEWKVATAAAVLGQVPVRYILRDQTAGQVDARGEAARFRARLPKRLAYLARDRFGDRILSARKLHLNSPKRRFSIRPRQSGPSGRGRTCRRDRLVGVVVTENGGEDAAVIDGADDLEAVGPAGDPAAVEKLRLLRQELHKSAASGDQDAIRKLQILDDDDFYALREKALEGDKDAARKLAKLQEELEKTAKKGGQGSLDAKRKL